MACIRTHLISGASAVSLVPRPNDWTRLLSSSLSQGPPSSLSLFCAGMLGGACERSYSSLAGLPQQLHEQHALLSLLSWAYSTCVLFALLFRRCHVRFYVSLSGSSVVCGPSWVMHFENTIVPYR